MASYVSLSTTLFHIGFLSLSHCVGISRLLSEFFFRENSSMYTCRFCMSLAEAVLQSLLCYHLVSFYLIVYATNLL